MRHPASTDSYPSLVGVLKKQHMNLTGDWPQVLAPTDPARATAGPAHLPFAHWFHLASAVARRRIRPQAFRVRSRRFIIKEVFLVPLTPKRHQPNSFVEANPSAFSEFMRRDWAPRAKALVTRHPWHVRFQARRRALSRQFPGFTLVIPSGGLTTRSNDTQFRFRPGSNFFWLTGCPEPDAVLVMVPQRVGPHATHLFVHPLQGKETDAFYADKEHGELWVGTSLGVDGNAARAGVTKGHALAELNSFLRDAGRHVEALRGLSPVVDALPRGKASPLPLEIALAELRIPKDKLEVGEIERAIAISKRCFEDVIRTLGPGTSEREVEVAFDARARREALGNGFITIAASGKNGCIVHYEHSAKIANPGSLMLVDAGVEMDSLYTSDLTRVFPVDGTFTLAQRRVTAIVHRAKEAAIDSIRPGRAFSTSRDVAYRELAKGLVDLGVLRVGVEEALAPSKQFHKRYTLHGISHMLGVDVHDCAQARAEKYLKGKYRSGMVFTVEPGLYFQPDDLTVPKDFRGIGVRLEDDVLVTGSGCRNLSRSIPSEPAEVEAWIRAVQGPPSKRARKELR